MGTKQLDGRIPRTAAARIPTAVCGQLLQGFKLSSSWTVTLHCTCWFHLFLLCFPAPSDI